MTSECERDDSHVEVPPAEPSLQENDCEWAACKTAPVLTFLKPLYNKLHFAELLYNTVTLETQFAKRANWQLHKNTNNLGGRTCRTTGSAHNAQILKTRTAAHHYVNQQTLRHHNPCAKQEKEKKKSLPLPEINSQLTPVQTSHIIDGSSSSSSSSVRAGIISQHEPICCQ